MTASELARVLRVSRRNATVLCKDEGLLSMRVGNKIDKLAVGDMVNYEVDHGVYYVSEVAERKNCLARTYRKRSKEIAANVDLICVIAAMQPLFNTHFVDRCLTLACLEQIPTLLIVNKDDLGEQDTQEEITTYRNLNIELITSNTVSPDGLVNLEETLGREALEVVVLLGISGVGKSSIFNKLVPEASQDVGAVSSKTGQGTQTTSQSIGYQYKAPNGHELILVDLPGIQHFGVSNLDKALVRLGFLEFVNAASQCEYSDCYHLAEPNCEVKRQVSSGGIATSRYESYLSIVEEVENAREY